jgi:hypothetical protein
VAGLARVAQRAAIDSRARWFQVAGATDRSDRPALAAPSGAPPDYPRARRVQLLALLSALAGDPRGAVGNFADPSTVSDARLHRLATRAAVYLRRRFVADGIPFPGLPLHVGLCAVEGRTMALLAQASFRRGRLSSAGVALARRAALVWSAILTELLAGLARADEGGGPALRAFEQVIREQRLAPRAARLLHASLADPRTPEELAAPLQKPAQRRFALEQLLLAAQVDGRFGPGGVAYVHRLAEALGFGADELSRIDAEVEQFHAANEATWRALRGAQVLEGLPRALTSRMQAAVEDNLDRLLQEIRETGELAELLAKAASGTALTAVEQAKVREQLIDLAKSIPALAIFAAPGGALLLFVLLRVLPFNLLPSSFIDERPRLQLPPRREATPPASRPAPE